MDLVPRMHIVADLLIYLIYYSFTVSSTDLNREKDNMQPIPAGVLL